MEYLTFEQDRKYDLILLGRIAIDFNPLDYYKTLAESGTFRKYVGGSPANIAVGLSRLGKKCGFFARISHDRFGEFVVNFFKEEGIDTSHIRPCVNGESLGLTFTEILSHDESSILMYRNGVADLSLCPEDIDEDYLKEAKAILISGTALAASPSREAALKAVALAKRMVCALSLTLTTARITGRMRMKSPCITVRWQGTAILSWVPGRSMT